MRLRYPFSVYARASIKAFIYVAYVAFVNFAFILSSKHEVKKIST